MRKNSLLVVLLILSIATVMSVFLLRRSRLSGERLGFYSDSTYVPLPTDKKQAARTLDKARKALARYEPKGPYIVIDTHANKLSLRTSDKIIFKATCSTGSGGVLVDSLTGRKWIFNTPRGVFKVNSKLAQPWWRKPDWAFIEENEPVPKNESDRLDPEMLGDYALGFGDGYFIHGTVYERLLGVSVTHGCVRLGSEDLRVIYNRVNSGTQVYIF